MSSLAPNLQVEQVLDDLIQRLVSAENTPEVRAALIEARRLKNVTTRWAAIPPPLDAKREMLSRVMELSDTLSSQERITGPHSPFDPKRASSPKSLLPKPSKETAAAETLSPPDEVVSEVQVPRPAAVPNLDHRGKPLTLRPPQPFAPARSSMPDAPKPAPIKAVGARGDTVEGFSSTISSTDIKRATPNGSPSAQILTPLPPSPRDISVTISAGVILVRPASAEWQPHPLWNGTSVKLLSHDTERGEYTALVRLSPGSNLPTRRHVTIEELWMVEGTAVVGGVQIKAGEYSRGDAGAVHPKIASSEGCTFLLRASENDEILSGPLDKDPQ